MQQYDSHDDRQIVAEETGVCEGGKEGRAIERYTYLLTDEKISGETPSLHPGLSSTAGGTLERTL